MALHRPCSPDSGQQPPGTGPLHARASRWLGAREFSVHACLAAGLVGVCQPPWAPRALTLSWDLETLPLFSTSSAVKAYQMDFSSSFRRAMAEAPAHGGSDTEIRFQEMQTVAETTEGLARGESSTCLLAGCLC